MEYKKKLTIAELTDKEIADGIVDKNKYNNAKYRVLFLLKESWWKHQEADANFWYSMDYSICNLIQDEKQVRKHWQTYDNLARWTALILNNKAQIEKYNPEQRVDLLSNIAFLNCKKTLGDTSSNDLAVTRDAVDHAEKLKRQIEKCNPDIIICCGTFEALEVVENYDKFRHINNEEIWRVIKETNLTSLIKTNYVENTFDRKRKSQGAEFGDYITVDINGNNIPAIKFWHPAARYMTKIVNRKPTIEMLRNIANDLLGQPKALRNHNN